VICVSVRVCLCVWIASGNNNHSYASERGRYIMFASRLAGTAAARPLQASPRSSWKASAYIGWSLPSTAPQEKRLYRDRAWLVVRRMHFRRGSVTSWRFLLPLHANPAQRPGHQSLQTWRAVVLLSRSVCLSVCIYRQCGCLVDLLRLCFVFTHWSRDCPAHMTLYAGTVSTTLVG
jgi:hypothetical protein